MLTSVIILFGPLLVIENFDQDKRNHLLSRFVTVSDEAYALLVCENNLEKWFDMYKRQDRKKSDVVPKYTNGGKSNHTNGLVLGVLPVLTVLFVLTEECIFQCCCTVITLAIKIALHLTAVSLPEFLGHASGNIQPCQYLPTN